MVSEVRIDQIEAALRAKIETMTGFADQPVKQRCLQKVFHFFDLNDTGLIEYDAWFAALTRLNFVGVQRELEALFDRYDDDCSGALDYNEFCHGIFGVGQGANGINAAKGTVERVKARILELGGANGIRTVTHLLKRMDRDGSCSIDRSELAHGLEAFGLGPVDDAPGGDLDRLMDYFDRDQSGRISVEEFHRGLQGNIGRRRKLLVRAAFNRLDRTGDGCITVDDLRASYDTSMHPDVASGRITGDQALRELLAGFEKGGEPDGTVTWAEFLSAYKDMSAGIPDDDYFELMICNAFHMSSGSEADPTTGKGARGGGWVANSTCRRVD